jgi:hypothetical protein
VGQVFNLPRTEWQVGNLPPQTAAAESPSVILMLQAVTLAQALHVSDDECARLPLPKTNWKIE